MPIALPLTLPTTVLHATKEGIQLLVQHRLNGAARGGTQAILNPDRNLLHRQAGEACSLLASVIA